MKREICCQKCTESWRGLVGRYPGEYIKIVTGILGKYCMCDGCGETLPRLSEAHAVSLYTDEKPYFPWEEAYFSEEKTE